MQVETYVRALKVQDEINGGNDSLKCSTLSLFTGIANQ